MIKNNISVIIPAYNESEYIRNALRMISEYLNKSFGNFEIIVVDDGSSDGTYDYVLNLAKEFPNLKVLKNEVNYGKGYSVRKGVLSAVYEYIVFTDADLSTPIQELDRCMEEFRNGADIVIGSRALGKSQILKRQGFLRMNMGKVFNMLVQLFLFKGIKDTQCGFKCFKAQPAKKIFQLQALNRFCFDVETLYIARQKGYLIKEIPVRWVNRVDSRLSIIKDSANMFLDIFKIKLNAMKGYYAV